ncbi:hypothetical protein SOASR030_01790 [Leminorella grimontii]|uniref:Uncharacterized protein n=1 Tax=Leminorella grimontii TaxID=82981 RepID=A0AAV5MX87_9GAMM|nr:hypothetical protein [Leminorella grimontii]GKX54067.1 hypothetical protein SOASR030_01790 [Leminorella grimontii]VFS60160.1 Uncharacterised protein [Leminorella grimontii]
MSYIQENIRLLSTFCTTDSRTVLTMKTYVLPWAKERLEDRKQLMKLAQSVGTPSLSEFLEEEIEVLTDGILLCEQRLAAIGG